MPHKDILDRRAYFREYKRLNRGRRRQMTADSDRARHANDRARAYGAPGRITIADVRAVLAVGACFYCGATDGLGIDHVVPLHKRGPNVRENIVACCHPCNASKHRADRPRRWSWKHDACIQCKTSERPHLALGLCVRCYRTKGRLPADRNARAKVGPDEVRQIRQRHATGESYAVLVAAFGLTKSTISKIVLRRSWGEVE